MLVPLFLFYFEREWVGVENFSSNLVVPHFSVLFSGTFFCLLISPMLSSSVVICCVITPLCATGASFLFTEIVARFLFCF